MAHTPLATPVLVLDDATPHAAVVDVVESVAASHPDTDLVYARQLSNVGFVENANTAFRMSDPADAVILNSDCVVAAEWLERLRAAAYSDTLIATASALTNHGTILSVPDRNKPRRGLPEGVDFDEAAAAIRGRSKRLRPRIPTAVGHCVYIRREALDLAGWFDPAFSPGYGEEVDFSQRCVTLGLSHVAADDVLVFHAAESSFGDHGRTLRAEHEQLVFRRYPFYEHAVTAAAYGTSTPLARSLAIARRSMKPLSVTIDGRILGPSLTGTQLHVIELVSALSRTGELDLRLIAPADVGEYAQRALGALDVDRVTPERLGYLTPTDVVHRPYQIFTVGDLETLVYLGERVVVTNQDLIAFRNPSYFSHGVEWRAYQHLTRQALAIADRVVFFSEHAARDAMSEDLVDSDRTRVVYVGTDHRGTVGHAPRRPPAVLGDRPFLLCLGTNFRHKNRVFALALLDELRVRHNWDGRLVFAGPHAASGTSENHEAAFLTDHPDLAERVLDLEAVDEEEKTWLLAHAALVVYPTLYEGFGLVPFEAAEAGAATVFAAQTALAEILPAHAATIVPWDAAATADRVIELLKNPQSRDALVDAIRKASRRYAWDATAAALVETYIDAVESPASPARAAWLGDGALRLVREQDLRTIVAAFPPEVHRPLVALAARPRLRRTLFTTLRAVYATAYFVRHRRRSPPI